MVKAIISAAALAATLSIAMPAQPAVSAELSVSPRIAKQTVTDVRYHHRRHSVRLAAFYGPPRCWEWPPTCAWMANRWRHW